MEWTLDFPRHAHFERCAQPSLCKHGPVDRGGSALTRISERAQAPIASELASSDAEGCVVLHTRILFDRVRSCWPTCEATSDRGCVPARTRPRPLARVLREGSDIRRTDAQRLKRTWRITELLSARGCGGERREPCFSNHGANRICAGLPDRAARCMHAALLPSTIDSAGSLRAVLGGLGTVVQT